MASNGKSDKTKNMSDASDSAYALQGIKMWLNNTPLEADEHFRKRKSSLQVEAGYTFLSFLNAIISWETNKIEESQKQLRELEKHCHGDAGWLKSVRVKLFGSSTPSKTLAESLEEQIILADSQLCTSILTGLTQDIGGMMKAGWSLRKAWKLYQNSYSQISELYRQAFQLNLHGSNSSGSRSEHDRKKRWSTISDAAGPSSKDEIRPYHSPNDSPSHCYDIPFPITTSTNDTSSDEKTNKNNNTNGFGRDELPASSRPHPTITTAAEITSASPDDAATAVTTAAVTSNSAAAVTKIPKSFTISESMQSSNQSPSNDLVGADESHHSHQQTNNNSTVGHPQLHKIASLDDDSLTTGAANSAAVNGYHLKHNVSQSYSMHDFNDYQPARHNYQARDISKEDLKRLMGAASFGYGLFQLSVSLLPPNLLKLISFFGFEGDRRIGIACLKHSRQSEDMRAPLATLSLLWYYTIITPFFALDGTNLDTEIEEANVLLEEAQEGYADAALFLFFKGRVERLKVEGGSGHFYCTVYTKQRGGFLSSLHSNIPNAIVSYETSHRVSVQREIKLLCLHEIGWCRLIQLDFGKAMEHFKELKQHSQFSKSFYAYMKTICQAAFGDFDDLVDARDEIYGFISSSYLKDFWDEYISGGSEHESTSPNAMYLQESQIEKYILRRVSKLPCEDTETEKFDQIYWKYLVYEMLVMWNAINSCSEETLKIMMEDCKKTRDQLNEPMKGLAKLVLGSCHGCLKNYDEAIIAYRECIEQRGELLDDLHISAFAYFELGMLLLKHRNDKSEARRLLSHIQNNYHNYDFENRLGIRVHSVLKTLT